MKNIVLFIVLMLVLLSCTQQSDLSKKFDCKVVEIKNKKEITDFNKNFKLIVPTDWKSKLYFSKNESEIFVADTLKQLTNSFILLTSFNSGEVIFDVNFHKKTDSVLSLNNLEIINSGDEAFQTKPTFWYVAKGFKNGFTFHQFNLTSKRTKNTYFNASVEIYGEHNINNRICEAISIIEKVEFLQ